MQKSKYTSPNEYYEVDDYFVEKIRELPVKLGLDIAKQIDRQIEELPEKKRMVSKNSWSVQRIKLSILFCSRIFKTNRRETSFFRLRRNRVRRLS